MIRSPWVAGALLGLILAGRAYATGGSAVPANPYKNNSGGDCIYGDDQAFMYRVGLDRAEEVLQAVPGQFDQIIQLCEALVGKLKVSKDVVVDFKDDDKSTPEEADRFRQIFYGDGIKAFDEYGPKIQARLDEIKKFSSDKLNVDKVDGRAKTAMDNGIGFSGDILKKIAEQRDAFDKFQGTIQANMNESDVRTPKDHRFDDAIDGINSLKEHLAGEKKDLETGKDDFVRARSLFGASLCNGRADDVWNKKKAADQQQTPPGTSDNTSPAGDPEHPEGPPATPAPAAPAEPQPPDLLSIQHGQQIGYIAQDICAQNPGNPACANIWDPQNGLVAKIYGSIENPASPDPTKIYSGTAINLTKLRQTAGVK